MTDAPPPDRPAGPDATGGPAADRGPFLSRRQTLGRGALGLGSLAIAGWLLDALFPRTEGQALPTPVPAPRETPVATPRLVSLSPALTDSLQAIGAGSSLVGVSQFCRRTDLPRVGTSITPNFERIAQLAPTLIVTTEVAGSRMKELARIARTAELPWLTLSEVTAGVRSLGTLSGRTAPAAAVAARLERELAPTYGADAPRVLALLGGFEGEMYYVRRGSLHSCLLESCGYRNAAAAEPPGPPRMALERLLKVNPDAIVIFRNDDEGSITTPEVLAPLRRLTPLAAVAQKHLAVFARPHLLSMGPQILDHKPALQQLLHRLFAATGPDSADGSAPGNE